MVYKMLAVNIDGTLLQNNGKVSKATREALEYVHEKGVAVVFVTSRNFQSCKKLVKALKIRSMVVAAQGAYIGAYNDKPLFIKKLDEETTMLTAKFLENLGCHFKLNLLASQLANRVDLPENLLGKMAVYVSEQTTFSQHYVDSVSGHLENNPATPMSIEAFFKNKREQQDAMDALTGMFTDIQVIQKEENKLLITSAQVSKWRGVRYLADFFGIEDEEIVSIGNGKDDMDLINGSGVGVAMGNGDAELKAAADWITRSNDEDGVSYMVKELFRKQYQFQFLEKMNLMKK